MCVVGVDAAVDSQQQHHHLSYCSFSPQYLDSLSALFFFLLFVLTLLLLCLSFPPFNTLFIDTPWHFRPAHPPTPTDTHTHTHTLTDETPGSRAKQKSTSHPLPLVSAVTCPSVRSPIGQPSCDPRSKGFWDLEFPRVKSSTGIYCTGSHVYSCVCVTYSLSIDYLSMRKQRGFSLKAWSILPIPLSLPPY